MNNASWEKESQYYYVDLKKITYNFFNNFLHNFFISTILPPASSFPCLASFYNHIRIAAFKPLHRCTNRCQVNYLPLSTK